MSASRPATALVAALDRLASLLRNEDHEFCSQEDEPMPERLQQIVESDAQKWERNRLLRGKVGAKPEDLGPSICIAREYGAGGHTVARKVGELLGMPVYDRELVEAIGQRADIQKLVLQSVDEQTRGWLADLVRDLCSGDATAHWRYDEQLASVMLTLAHHGDCILVGRGASFLVPRRHSLSARFVADRLWRIRRVMELRGMSETDAADLVDQKDKDRDNFVRRTFSASQDDARHYDMVLNAGTLSFDAMAALVAKGFQVKYQKHAEPRTGGAGKS
jgi:cytidylate kinase